MSDLSIWQLPLLILMIVAPIALSVAFFYVGVIIGEYISDFLGDIFAYNGSPWFETPIIFISAVTGVVTAIVLIIWSYSHILA